jgi:hypothetical protein
MHAVVAGAIFDFAAWLTMRETPITIGSGNDAAPVVALIEEWAHSRGVDIDSQSVAWKQGLIMLTGSSAVSETLDSQISRLAEYIMRDFPEYIQNEGAVDVAIRIMNDFKEQAEAIADLGHEKDLQT